jgi:flagellar motor switch protein FliM
VATESNAEIAEEMGQPWPWQEATAASPFVTTADVKPFRYGTSGSISKEQLTAIRMLNELFARNLSHNLGAWAHTTLRANLAAIERIVYVDLLEQIPGNGTYLASVKSNPIGVLSLLQLDLSLVPPLIDLLLGGTGKIETRGEPTEIEEAILRSAIDVICREMSSVWQSVGLQMEFDRRQLYTQLGRLMSPRENVLCLTFELQLSGATGRLQFVLPAVVSNVLVRRLSKDWERQHRGPSDTRKRLEELVQDVRYGVTLQLPPFGISARSVSDLQPGSVLQLDLSAEEPARMLAAGHALFEARPVARGAHRAAHLGERCTKLRDLTDVTVSTLMW